MSAFSPGSTRQRQLAAVSNPRPLRVSNWVSLFAITQDYILIQMQEKYTKVIGSYRLTDRLLGQGSFSSVFLAYAAQKRRVAVKVIPRTQISPDDTAGFQSQVEILRSLRHQHIVRLVDFKKSQHNFYLFLQYCQGGSLADYIRKHHRLSESQALRIFKQILLGVSAMHHYKIVHRDLKPANILFQNGRVKIADFGLARKFSHNQMMRSFAGTPYNMAPEILRGHLYGQQVDVYSAGTVLFQMLYGYLPFKGGDQRSLLESIEKGRIEPPSQEVSQRTQHLLKQMLTPKPEERIALWDVLDIVNGYQAEARAKRLEEYRVKSLDKVQYIGAPGGLSCGLEMEVARGEANEMDQRLYSRLCQKLSAECVAAQ